MPISNYIVIFKIYNNVWTVTIIYGICVYCKGVDFMSILQDLWYGIIKPNEDKFITESEKNLVQLITRHYETLSSSLNDDEREILKNMLSSLQNTHHLLKAKRLK